MVASGRRIDSDLARSPRLPFVRVRRLPAATRCSAGLLFTAIVRAGLTLPVAAEAWRFEHSAKRPRRPKPRFLKYRVTALVVAIVVIGFGVPASGSTVHTTSTLAAPTPPFKVRSFGKRSDGTPLVSSASPIGLAPATIGAVYNLDTGLLSPAM